MDCAVCAGALSRCSAQAPAASFCDLLEKQQVSDVSKLVDKTVGLQFGLVGHTHNEQCPPYQRKQWAWLWLLTATGALSLASGNQHRRQFSTFQMSPHNYFPVSHKNWCTRAALALTTSCTARKITRRRYTTLFDRSSQRNERRPGIIPCPREKGSSRTPPCKQGCPEVCPQTSKKSVSELIDHTDNYVSIILTVMQHIKYWNWFRHLFSCSTLHIAS